VRLRIVTDWVAPRLFRRQSQWLASDLSSEGATGEEDIAMTARPGENLDNQLARLSLVLENAPVILYGLDRDGRFLFSEGDGIAAMGLKKGQIVGNSAFDLYRNNPGADEAIRSALAGEHAVFRAHFGGAHFVSRLTPVFDDAGRVEQVVGVSVDTGGQVRAEEELSQRDDQLRQSQKMEAVGQLAGGIAHDFNNLLTAIIGYSDLLLESEDCPLYSVRGDVEEIRRAAERAAGLTRQILAFSRRQPMQMEITSLNAVLRETEPLLHRTLGGDVELDLNLDPELGWAEVDPSQLVQVIMNLSLNARDAMPGGGRLSLVTANIDLDADFCWMNSALSPGAHVMLTVSDTGAGMDAKTLSRIFEPFFTTKGPTEGTGLGLSTVYGIVRQSGGDIVAESEPGSGASFRIFFPRLERPAEKLPTVVAPRTLNTSHAVILVVEDEPAVRALVTRVLTGDGHVVFAAGDASQALAILEQKDRWIDLLLTDVVLPRGLQGDGLAREALALRAGLPILFMSGHPRESLLHAGILPKGVDYLPKPFTPDSLSRKVREVLEAPKP
jgi:two-component system, cell cycle sensor histidine kinase and response regulator CckA